MVSRKKRPLKTSDPKLSDEVYYPADTLGLEPGEMRRLGYKVVDLVVDRLQRKNHEHVVLTGEPAMLMSILGGPIPETPLDADESLALLADVALTHQQHGDHPRYFARIPGPNSFAAVLGEWMASGFNTIASSWVGGSGPATIELVVVEWLRQLMGFPENTEGVLLSGGSLANLTAFSVARSIQGDGIVYLSDQTHSSLVRDLREIGLSDSQICILESDENYKIPLARLSQAVAEDNKRQRRPLMIIGTAGTTNTGAVDPLHAIADMCAKENIWFHVDGAYGAPAAITDRGKTCLAGLERADSLVLDPHKWLFQPYDVGCLLVRHPGALERCFSMNPEYLQDVHAQNSEVNFRNRSLELSRRSRAVKIWMCFRTYGLERIREAITKGIKLAEFAQAHLQKFSDTWEVVTPAQIGIICFTLKNIPADELGRRVKALTDSGYAAVTITKLRGRQVLRLCTINPLTTEKDIITTIDRLAKKR